MSIQRYEEHRVEATATEMGTQDGPRLAPKFLTAVVLYAASPAVWAGPPFRTDDPEAVEYQHA